MALILTFIYLAYMIVSPVTWFPELASANIQVYVAILALLATTPKLINHSPFRFTPQIGVAAALFLVLIFSPLKNLWFGGVPKAFMEQFPLLVLVFLLRMNSFKPSHRRFLVIGIVGIMSMLAVVGIYQYRANPDEPDNKWVLRHSYIDMENAPMIYRLKAQGLLDDPNDFAQALLVCAALSISLWGDRFLGNLLRVILPVSILCYAVFLTRSRGALMAIAAMIAFGFRRHVKPGVSVLIAVAAAGALAAANFTGGREISVEGGVDRLDIWSDGLGLLKQTYFTGIGYGQFTERVGITAHNSFLLVACELGFVGLILFMALWVLSFSEVNRIGREAIKPDGDVVTLRESRACELALVAFLATSWFLSRAFTLVPSMLLGLISGFVADQGQRVAEGVLLPRWPVWLRTSILLSVFALLTIYSMVRMRSIG